MRIAVILLMVVAATRPFTLAGAENADSHRKRHLKVALKEKT